MNNVFFSIIIPFFNRTDKLIDTIDSILNQSFKNWECLLVDDGTDISNLNKIKKVIQKDNRFKYFKRHLKLKGASVCRNIGLNNASGDFVIFMDSDNFLMDFALKERYSIIKNHPCYDIYISQQKLIDDDDVTIGVLDPIKSSRHVEQFCLFRHPNIRPQWMNEALTINRKYLLDKHITWLEHLQSYQDLQFNIDLFLTKPKIKYFNFIDCKYKIHNENRINNKLEDPKNLYEYYRYLISRKKIILKNGVNKVLFRRSCRKLLILLIQIQSDNKFINSFDSIFLRILVYKYSKKKNGFFDKLFFWIQSKIIHLITY